METQKLNSLTTYIQYNMDPTIKNISYVTLSNFIRDIILDKIYHQNIRHVFVVCSIKLPTLVQQGAPGGARSRKVAGSIPDVVFGIFH
jgi:hypothetical protein